MISCSSSSGIRTHSIAVSETTWSASCLPSHIHAGAQSEIRTHNHSILSRVALPAGVSRRGNGMIPDGLEPSFSGCKPGVVATGPRDQSLTKAEAVRLELTSEMCSPPVFETGSSTSRMTSIQHQAAMAGIEPASGRLTVAFPYQHRTHRIERMKDESGSVLAFTLPPSDVIILQKRPVGFEPTQLPWQSSTLPLHHGR